MDCGRHGEPERYATSRIPVGRKPRSPREVGMVKKVSPVPSRVGCVPRMTTPGFAYRSIRKEGVASTSDSCAQMMPRFGTPACNPARFRPPACPQRTPRSVSRIPRMVGKLQQGRTCTPSLRAGTPFGFGGRPPPSYIMQASNYRTPAGPPVPEPSRLASPPGTSECPPLPPRVTPPGEPWATYLDPPPTLTSPIRRATDETTPRAPFKWPEGMKKIRFRGAMVGRWPRMGERVTGFGGPFRVHCKGWGPESYITPDFEEDAHETYHPFMKVVGSIPPTEPTEEDYNRYFEYMNCSLKELLNAEQRTGISKERYEPRRFPSWVSSHGRKSRMVFPYEQGYQPPPC